jgi:microcompartment protein CcmL/EutN
MNPAIAILEFDSIAHGIAAGDAMVKRSPLDVLLAGTVHPGRYLLLAGGATAEVEEAVTAARAVGAAALIGVTFLPDVHPTVVAAIGGARQDAGEALGVIETRTVTAVVAAADAAVKNAGVVLRELRLADGLGGKGYALIGGPLTEVEAAIEHGVARIGSDGDPATHVVVAQLHPEMDDNLRADARFAARTSGITKGVDGPAGAEVG